MGLIMPRCFFASVMLTFGLAATRPLAGQGTVEPNGRLAPPPPSVLIRQDDGDAVAVATYVETPPTIDGVLDEPYWKTIVPISGFLQRDPVDGAPASERSEVRIAYDRNALYFALVLHDREPHLIRRSILHREGRIDQDDRVIIAIDTFHDRRNAYIFELNSFGTQGDAYITDESMTLADWNWEGVYRSEGRVTDDGWVLEVAIPFTTIRFSDADVPQMGIAFYRSIRRKDENVFWPHIPQRYRAGISQVSQYATLSGLRNLRRGRYVEIKPFAIAGGQRLETGSETDFVRDAGVDLKYAVTSNVTLDLTYNTDFAQVEADNVQINLSRFSLFFPEKREFFLERAGLFTFGDQREAEVFFSRRIGLTNDIIGGGRVTGTIGPVSLALLNLQTDDSEITKGANNGVIRMRTDLSKRANIGGIFTNLQSADRHNRVAGADGTVRFWSSSSLRGWAAKVWDDDLAAAPGTAAGAAELVLRNDRYMMELAYTNIGENYQPGLGFVSRPDQIRFGGQIGVTPRFERSTWARQLSVFLQANHIEGQDGIKQSHFRRIDTRLSTQTGDRLGANLSERFERLFVPFSIQSDVTIPAGDYTFRAISANINTNESRTLSGFANVSIGQFFSGTRNQYRGRLTWKTGPHLTLAGTVTLNDISLPVPNGDFSTALLGFNVGAAASRKLFANALVQWDDVSRTLQSNIRVDWIHTPGSDLFVVLDTGYRTGNLTDPLRSRWTNRTGVMKLTYLRAL